MIRPKAEVPSPDCVPNATSGQRRNLCCALRALRSDYDLRRAHVLPPASPRPLPIERGERDALEMDIEFDSAMRLSDKSQAIKRSV